MLIYKRQGLNGDENDNYLKLLNNIYFKQVDDYVIGEPITTSYGKGYLSDKIQEDKNEIVVVKYKYGHCTFK